MQEIIWWKKCNKKVVSKRLGLLGDPTCWLNSMRQVILIIIETVFIVVKKLGTKALLLSCTRKRGLCAKNDYMYYSLYCVYYACTKHWFGIIIMILKQPEKSWLAHTTCVLRCTIPVCNFFSQMSRKGTIKIITCTQRSVISLSTIASGEGKNGRIFFFVRCL